MLDRMFDAVSPIVPSAETQTQEILHHTDKIYAGFYDDIRRRILDARGGDTANHALDELFSALHARYSNASPLDWKSFVATSRVHPIVDVLHRDPFTFRAYSKPRGYAGDAEMMDYIYSGEDQRPAPQGDPIGLSVFRYTTLAPASEGVRARRAFISTQIDRLAEERHRPHILSIAAGHLREASLSVAVRRRRTGRFLALDADPLSAAEVKRCYSAYGVETVTASFTRLLGRPRHQNEFDLVYSTGLFDYLNQRTGRRLVWSMFQMLRPGGSLIVANFLPGVRDVGYMETFMDWNLIYRTRSDMVDLTMDIPESDVKEVQLFSEECKNIVFLLLTRN